MNPYAEIYDWNNPQSLNRYVYAENDPASLTDSSGRWVFSREDGNWTGDGYLLQYPTDELSEAGADPQLKPRPPGGDPSPSPCDGPNDPLCQASPNFNKTPCAFSADCGQQRTPRTPPPAPSKAPSGCMVVNGRNVCPSPIDKYNFLHPGQTNYRDNRSRCSQHTTVNNTTGQVKSHIDEFNPNDFFLEHVVLDVIPDVIYDITGSYLFPTGNQFCPQ